MTEAKKLKQRIRARMEKTGESYAAARARVVAKKAVERSARTRAAAKEAASRKATGTVTEARCIEKTGHGFEHWFGVLDRFRAPAQGHTAAAKHLRDDHGVGAWYAQAITVSYERARGIRVENQTCDGNFQVSVSKVLPAQAGDVAAALREASFVDGWLDGVDAAWAKSVRQGLAEKPLKLTGGGHTIRFAGATGAVALRLDVKDDRSSIHVQVRKLGSVDEVEAVRAVWRSLATRLKERLTPT